MERIAKEDMVVSKQNNESVLVCGGSGFLGSHVADALSDAGFKVRIFDTRVSPYLRPDQKMIVGSILDLGTLVEAVRGCSFVYNFAGISDIAASIDNREETTRFNVLGNMHVLEASRLNRAKRYVFASTVYVYSKMGSFYRASKQVCEKQVENYFDGFGLEYTILRYGSLYGRRSDSRNGIYRLVQQALKRNEMSYGGTEHAMREYVHVLDAAKLSVEILSEEFSNKPVIITGHERMTVGALMRMIAEMVPGNPTLKFGAFPVEGHYEMTPYSFNPKHGKILCCDSNLHFGNELKTPLNTSESKEKEVVLIQ